MNNPLIDEEPSINYYREVIARKCNGLVRHGDILEKIVCLVGENPGIPNNSIQNYLDISLSSFYKHHKQAVDSGCITKDNRLNFPKYNRNFLIPNILRQGILPAKNYAAVHLAAHLANYTNIQTPVGWILTKEEILQEIKTWLSKNPDRAKLLVDELQNNLALYSLFVGDTSQYANMVGQLQPPIDLDHL